MERIVTVKEQSDTLFKAMADAGYTFDFEKKELENIEQKSVWSEEDDYVIERLFCLLDNEQDKYSQLSSDFQEIEEIKNKLKSLKDRVQLKQEWSEMPKRIYIFDYNDAMVTPLEGDTIYVKEDAFIEKAEEFIRDCTRNCSNEIAHWDIGGENVKPIYSPWLTPDQARSAVEIAREEMIDKFCEWVKKNVTYIHPRKGTEECVINLGKLKEAMRHE